MDAPVERLNASAVDTHFGHLAPRQRSAIARHLYEHVVDRLPFVACQANGAPGKVRVLADAEARARLAADPAEADAALRLRRLLEDGRTRDVGAGCTMTKKDFEHAACCVAYRDLVHAGVLDHVVAGGRRPLLMVDARKLYEQLRRLARGLDGRGVDEAWRKFEGMPGFRDRFDEARCRPEANDPKVPWHGPALRTLLEKRRAEISGGGDAASKRRRAVVDGDSDGDKD